MVLVSYIISCTRYVASKVLGNQVNSDFVAMFSVKHMVLVSYIISCTRYVASKVLGNQVNSDFAAMFSVKHKVLVNNIIVLFAVFSKALGCCN